MESREYLIASLREFVSKQKNDHGRPRDLTESERIDVQNIEFAIFQLSTDGVDLATARDDLARSRILDPDVIRAAAVALLDTTERNLPANTLPGTVALLALIELVYAAESNPRGSDLVARSLRSAISFFGAVP